jgi:hypothetical protein
MLEIRDKQEEKAIILALEILSNLGTGQFSKVGTRLHSLHKDRKEKHLIALEKIFDYIETNISPNWKRDDPETSIYALLALQLLARFDQRFSLEKKLQNKIKEKQQ